MPAIVAHDALVRLARLNLLVVESDPQVVPVAVVVGEEGQLEVTIVVEESAPVAFRTPNGRGVDDGDAPV